jgi:predicted SnoaL-like aldol condensation-catalyzing enzyme
MLDDNSTTIAAVPLATRLAAGAPLAEIRWETVYASGAQGYIDYPDIVRIKDGVLVEHWDVIQDEATKKQSKSGNPMFGAAFPRYAN